MMKAALWGAVMVLAGVGAAWAEPLYTLGSTVPAEVGFTDQTGRAHTMGEFRGKAVVLEWANYQCPFSRKFYDSGAIQTLQAETVKAGQAWVSVISSAPGKQGHLVAKEAAAAVAKEGFKGTAVALDETGALGKAFAATNTPQGVVLDATGKVVYAGAMDSIPSFNKDDVAGATNYVQAALADVAAGRPVATPKTQPYGCSIKY